ncbi:histidine kinase [Microbacterium lacus]|uniref:sensor histidine kinase n=1 Tax=Microbacterium lacus TaxID=415217 RepID=UPI00384C6101
MSTPGTDRAGVIRWITLGVSLCALWVFATVGRMLAAGRSDIDAFTSTPVWTVAAPIAAAMVFALAVWNRFRGARALAPWILAMAGGLTFYNLFLELAAWLDATGQTGHILFLVVVVFATSGWMITLASAQVAAAAAGSIVIGDRSAARLVTFVLGALAIVILAGLLVPPAFALEEFGDTPTILPRTFVLSASAQTVSYGIVLAWMLSLLVAPLVLGVRAARTRGPLRPVLARLAVGAVLPFAVVLLCGVLGLPVAAGSNAEIETIALTFGFCTAFPLTAWWLSAVVRDATSGDGRAVTALVRIIPGLLWTVYGLALVQLVLPVATVVGLTAAASVILTALVFAATVVPWLWFVRWCIRRVDPRRAVAAAVIRAVENTDTSPGSLAEGALRQALDEPDARLLIARPDGLWWDASLTEEILPDPDLLATSVTDRTDRQIALFLSRHRFVDTRKLVDVTRPLVERAFLEASVRDQSDLLIAERERADAATTAARESIERDLHDGVQGRLVSLGLNLSLARETLSDPTSRLLVDETVEGIQRAVAELRLLATGTVSTTLVDRGLAAALGDLVRRVPLEVDLAVDDVRLDATTESVAYFVVAEALANVLKHADARHLSVVVGSTGSSVSVTIADDGAGGADPRLGSGLRGLTERVRAAGGHLVVSERKPRGTLLEAVLPCAR